MEASSVGFSESFSPSCSTKPDSASLDDENNSKTSTFHLQTENTNLELPKDLLKPNIFFDVLSRDTYESLDSQKKSKLNKLLPSNLSERELGGFLEKLFNPSCNVGFNNPVKRFYDSLLCGNFDSACKSNLDDIKTCLQLQHKLQMRQHYAKLLKTLLIRRRKLIESALKCGKDDKIVHTWDSGKPETKKDKLRKRSLKRVKLMLTSVKSQVGESCTLSSDDEDLAEIPKDPHVFPPNGKHGTTAADEHNLYSTLRLPSLHDLDMHQPSQMADVKTLLTEYKLLRKFDPDHPCLELSDVNLEEVIERTGLPPLPQQKQSVKKNVSSTEIVTNILSLNKM